MVLIHVPVTRCNARTVDGHTRRLIAACVLQLVLLVSSVHPAAAQRSAISGRVADEGTGRPLAGVTVGVTGTGRQVVTDSAGRFALLRLGSGKHTIAFELVGYARHEHALELEADQVAEIDVGLVQSPL